MVWEQSYLELCICNALQAQAMESLLSTTHYKYMYHRKGTIYYVYPSTILQHFAFTFILHSNLQEVLNLDVSEIESKADQAREVAVQNSPDCQEVAVQNSPDCQEVAVQTQAAECTGIYKNLLIHVVFGSRGDIMHTQISSTILELFADYHIARTMSLHRTAAAGPVSLVSTRPLFPSFFQVDDYNLTSFICKGCGLRD